jgi:hypothetical protein
MFKVYFLCFALFISLAVNAQSERSGTNTRLGNVAMSSSGNEPAGFTGQSGTGANIDVIYHKIFWRLNPDSGSVTTPTKYIRGSVQTNFKTIVADVSTISFDLKTSLTIDSVKFRGAKLAAGNIDRTVTNITTITLGATLAAIGTIDSFTVFYQGVPPAVLGSAEGFQLTKTPKRPGVTLADTGNYIYTLSESYEDRDWWPCKADMQDKIDSMEIKVSVPWTGADTFWVASNGRLIDSTISAGSRIFTFKNTYPMASYLVSVAVARYNRYYRSITLASGAVVPGVFNIFRTHTAAELSSYTSAMAIQDSVLYRFSQKYGDYPFIRDKYGYYEGLGGAGGMEHQTFSAIASNALADQATLSHELMHQWFGDKATFATWADLWLAEGFARYGEALAAELVTTTGLNPVSELSAAKTSARTTTTNRTKITSFSTSNNVWTTANVRAVYDRGCMVVSMLRALCGDTKFFQATRNYLDSANGAGYRSATTDSLKNNFSRVLGGYDLTPFFNDWVIGQGHPSTVINWNNPSPKVLAVSVASQTRTASATAAYFHNVIILRVQGSLAAEDTTIVIYDIDGNNLAKAGNGFSAAVAGNILYYPLSFIPTTVTFDPFSRTMSAGSTTKITTLDLSIVDFVVKQNGNVHDALFTLDNNSINSTITLERSADGVRFTELGDMALQAANTQNTKQYYLKDATPLVGANYYRVKYKYVDGSYKYSKTIKLTVTVAKDNFSLVNNPIKGNVQLKINDNLLLNQTAIFSIYDASGKLVNQVNKKINNQLTEIETVSLPKGSYVLKINANNSTTQIMKFITN